MLIIVSLFSLKHYTIQTIIYSRRSSTAQATYTIVSFPTFLLLYLVVVLLPPPPPHPPIVPFWSSRTIDSNCSMSRVCTLSSGSIKPRCNHLGIVVRAWLKPNLFKM